jgi:hypothetical protein
MQARMTDYVRVKKSSVPTSVPSRGFGPRKPAPKKVSISPRRSASTLSWFQWPSFDLNQFQKLFLLELVILCGLGLFFVFEASTAESFQMVGNAYHFLNQQSKWMAIGLVSFTG